MNKSTSKMCLQLIGYFIIIAIFCTVPSVGAITPEGMRLVGLFIAFIYGFAITADAWPALLTIILFPVTGLVDFTGVLGLSFGNDTVFFILLSLVLVAYMEKSGTAKYIATWLLKRKLLIGHPWRLLAMILFVCWLISCFVNAIAGMMLTWVFLYSMFDQFGYKPFDKFPTVILLGTCAVGGLGLSALPWGNNSIVILDAFTTQTGIDVNYFTYMGFTIPFGIITIAVYLLVCKFIFRIDVKPLKEFDPSTLSMESQTLNAEKLIAMLSMVALVLLILVPSCFPADSAIVALSNKFGLSGKLLLIFTIAHIIRIDGKPACNFPKLAKEGIGWKFMMIVSNIMVFSSLIGDEKAGISVFLRESIGPFFENQAAGSIIIIVTIITIVFTNFMINKIVAVLMISMTMPVIISLGLDPIQFLCLYSVACTIAFMLPSASQSATVLFSNTEWIRTADVFKYGLPVIIAMGVSIVIWDIVYFAIVC